jgi:putative membrane protein
LIHEDVLWIGNVKQLNFTGDATMMGGGVFGVTGFGGFGPFGLVGVILNLVITIGIIVGIVWLVTWLVRQFAQGDFNSPASQNRVDPTETPRQALQLRYARGEITRDQYELIKQDIL